MNDKFPERIRNYRCLNCGGVEDRQSVTDAFWASKADHPEPHSCGGAMVNCQTAIGANLRRAQKRANKRRREGRPYSSQGFKDR